MTPRVAISFPLRPLGAERVRVRWGFFALSHPPHPKSFSALKGGEGLGERV